jgi:hypothetical protein
MTEDVAGKLSYWSTRIVEVKIVSAMDEELTLEIWGWEEGYGKTYGREVTTCLFESAPSRRFRPHSLNNRSLPRTSRRRALRKSEAFFFGGCLEFSPACSLSLGGIRRA